MNRKIKVICTDTGKDVDADVIREGNGMIEVELGNSRVRLVKRKDKNLWVGSMFGMEFTTNGK